MTEQQSNPPDPSQTADQDAEPTSTAPDDARPQRQGSDVEGGVEGLDPGEREDAEDVD